MLTNEMLSWRSHTWADCPDCLLLHQRLWRTPETYVGLPECFVQMLTVARVTGMMRGFATRETAEGFWRRMAHITGAWCCNYNGGINYSMMPFVPSDDEELDEAEDEDADELNDA